MPQEAELMLTNPRDAFRYQSRSQVMVTFGTLGIVSYSGAALGGGSRGPDPPAPAKATCENRPDPMSFFGRGGVGGSTVACVPMFVFWRISVATQANK